ncbi:hypothetical protein LXL04_023593 [Taraxacum kok-saghyz]
MKIQDFHKLNAYELTNLCVDTFKTHTISGVIGLASQASHICKLKDLSALRSLIPVAHFFDAFAKTLIPIFNTLHGTHIEALQSLCPSLAPPMAINADNNSPPSCSYFQKSVSTSALKNYDFSFCDAFPLMRIGVLIFSSTSQLYAINTCLLSLFVVKPVLQMVSNLEEIQWHLRKKGISVAEFFIFLPKRLISWNEHTGFIQQMYPLKLVMVAMYSGVGRIAIAIKLNNK